MDNLIERKPLLLSSHRKSWQVSSLHGTEAEKSNLKIWEDVWKRDKNTCYFCGFVSSRWQEVHHLNDDHSDNNMSNLVTVCPLCHQSFHLNNVSTTNSGKIIWLPKISQQKLNYLCRAIFIAMDQGDETEEAKKKLPFQKMANSIYSALENRMGIVNRHFAQDASDPGTFGQVLLNMTPEQYQNREELLKDFKILHSSNKFPVQIKYWRRTVFHDLPLESWARLIED